MVEFKGTSKIIKSGEVNTKSKKVSEVAHDITDKTQQQTTKSSSLKDKILSNPNVTKYAELFKQKSQSIVKTAMQNPVLLKHTNNANKAVVKARGASPTFDKAIKYIDYSINFMMKSDDVKDRSEVVQYTRGPALFGIWVTIITFALFLVWGVLAPLNSAAVAQGKLVLESKKRIIQHHEGGTISRIYVKNGDEVDQGEILMSFDKTAMLAKRDSIKARVLTFEAENARLSAERDGLSKIKFKDELLKQAGKHEVAKIIQTQEKLFQARKDTFDGRTQVRKEKLKQFEVKRQAAETQLESIEKQINITQEQIESMSKLVQSGNAAKEMLRRYEQQMADLRGKEAHYINAIAEANEQISQETLDIENERTGILADVQKELRQNQEQLSNLTEGLKEAEDFLQKLDIVSPIAGTVNNLTAHTEGGTIQRDQVIMEIVPKDDKLVIDVKVNMDDIDVVRVGQYASIRLSPFKSRVVPPLAGRVVTVSADVSPPEYQGDQPHYKARVEIDKDSLEEISRIKGIELYPGMPGQVLIEIGTRTMLKYLLDPITMSFDRAFIEQ